MEVGLERLTYTVGEEDFDISLFRNGLDTDILLGLSTATITIMDDDGKVECETPNSS